MEDVNEVMREVVEGYGGKYHLHLVPNSSNGGPKLHSGWRSWMDDDELWYTCWDKDALETELMSNFGEEAKMRASLLDEELSTELWLYLVVYLEGGIAFTPAVDLTSKTGIEDYIPEGEDLLLVKSEESCVLLMGEENNIKLKRMIDSILQLGTENENAEPLNCEIWELEDVAWLELVCTCGCRTPSSNSTEYSESEDDGCSEDEDEEEEQFEHDATDSDMEETEE